MTEHTTPPRIQTHHTTEPNTSSREPTPTGTPTQEHSTLSLPSPNTPQDQSRGRPRYKRRQPSRRYFTPPSRIPSPIRPDTILEVESAPQDPDIFADAETDYFSSTDKADGPRAYRRHFFDAMPSIDAQSLSRNLNMTMNMNMNMNLNMNQRVEEQSIDAVLSAKR